MKKLLIIFCLIVITSCSDIKFIYNDNKNLINPLYEKTTVKTTGKSLAFITSYLPMFFGENKEDGFKLIINIEEEKTKRSVETNQATSNLRYELRFFYTLVQNKKNCITYEKEILSQFSVIPKSAGYNYGSDSSVDKKYELAISENLDKFVSILSEVNIDSCL